MTPVFFYSHSNIQRLDAVLNEECPKFNTWMKGNKLSVNIKKTNHVFKSKQKRMGGNLSLSFDGNLLKQ